MTKKCDCKKHSGKHQCACNALPDSGKKFPDGANYRIEVSGIETAGILGAVIEEAKKFKIPIHRAIATVKGSSYYTDEQLLALAHLAAKEKVEVIICPWKLAGLVFENPNRIFSDLRLTDEETEKYFLEINRCVKFGFRGFLVWDKDVLEVLDFKRRSGELPSETIFKLSTFANSVNSINFDSAVHKGADTINVANGLSLKELAMACLITPGMVKLDVHIVFWQLVLAQNSQGRLELETKPYDRIDDAPEIAKVCSPVYFKFEKGTPGIGVYDVPRSGWGFKELAEHKRGDVRTAAEIVKRIEKEHPQLKLSGWGPEDLRVPVINQSTRDLGEIFNDAMKKEGFKFISVGPPPLKYSARKGGK